MFNDGEYTSTFLQEPHSEEEKAAWQRAFECYRSEERGRRQPGWAAKKADDDWEQFLPLTNTNESDEMTG